MVMDGYRWMVSDLAADGVRHLSDVFHFSLSLQWKRWLPRFPVHDFILLKYGEFGDFRPCLCILKIRLIFRKYGDFNT